MPYLEPTVCCGSNSIGGPGARRICHLLASVPITNMACVQPTPSPIHSRQPPPNGKQDTRRRPAIASGRDRFVSGNKKREDLVSDLLVVHQPGFFFACPDQN